jgi:ribonucleotide monophosphatase NagD (HAD superfamily)
MLATNSGMGSVCVLSGVSRLEDIASQPPAGRPTYVMSHLGLIAEILAN